MSQPQLHGQDHTSVAKNQDFFADNEWYKNVQQDLEHYRFIAASATHETARARRLLDIGNGGVFIFPIDHIPEVEAIDIFVEDDFAVRYPTVKWSQMSALDMTFDRPFDTIIAINALHHIVDTTVRGTYVNMRRVIEQAVQHLEPGGRLVLLESTVPAWFLGPYKLVYPTLCKIWPLKHPATFQFNYRDILDEASRAGLTLEEFCWIPRTSKVLAFGVPLPPWIVPCAMGKFVFTRPA